MPADADGNVSCKRRGVLRGFGLTFDAKRGRRVAIAERKDVGGSCVNFGCKPTKAAIRSARVAYLARRGSEYGVRVVVEIDYKAMMGQHPATKLFIDALDLRSGLAHRRKEPARR